MADRHVARVRILLLQGELAGTSCTQKRACGGGMASNFEYNLQRKSHRISLPAVVTIHGWEMETLDWSLTGFQCYLGDFELPKGWSGTVDFSLPFQDMSISFQAEAVVQWVNEDRAGFAFSNLPPHCRNILKKYVESSVMGQLGDADNFIERIHGVELPVAVEDPFTESEEAAHRKQLYRKMTVSWLLAVVVFGGVLGVLAMNMSYAVSTHGVVSGALIDVGPEIGGLLSKVLVQEGDAVARGDLLFEVSQNQSTLQTEIRTKELEQARERVAALGKEIEEEQKAQQLYRAAARQKIANLKQKINEVQASVRRASLEFDRASRLVAQGVASRSMQDEWQERLDIAKRRKAALEEDLLLAEEIARGAEQGKYLSDGRAQGQLGELQAELRVQQRAVATAEANLKQAMAHQEHTRVYANVAGVVHAVKHAQGAALRPREAVVTLYSTERDPFILARFSFEAVQGIKPGSKADIFVPAYGLRLQGIVESMGQQALAMAGADQVSSSLDEMPVRISLSDQARSLPLGVSAVVKVRTSLMDSVRARLGWFP